jgi:hypothetical protein
MPVSGAAWLGSKVPAAAAPLSPARDDHLQAPTGLALVKRAAGQMPVAASGNINLGSGLNLGECVSARLCALLNVYASAGSWPPQHRKKLGSAEVRNKYVEPYYKAELKAAKANGSDGWMKCPQPQWEICPPCCRCHLSRDFSNALQ